MPRIAAVAIVVAVLLAAMPGAALAQTCGYNAVSQTDMAGVYVNPASPMRVEVFPCGGMFVQWIDQLGIEHRAVYATTDRLPGGGYISAGLSNQHGVFLDNSYRLLVKPAEPGFVQVATPSAYDETFRVYRLKRIS